MKTIEIIGYKRANLGKADSKQLREEGNVPCVLYGGDEQVHFYAPMILFKELVYTQDAHYVNIDVEGTQYNAILQDIQFHPVSEVILHADFLQLFEGKSITMNIPVNLTGTSKGVVNGGILVHKRRTLQILSLPKNMPSHIDVDITDLDFHHSVKVQDVASDDFEILDTKIASIAVVEVPRALKAAEDEEEEGEEGEELEGEEGEEGAAEGDASAPKEGSED